MGLPMSDEPQPLRLKPRAPSGGDAPPPAASTPAPAGPGEAAPGGGTIRLKPRLSLAPEPAAQAPAEAGPEPTAAAAPAAAEAPVFKLRPKGAPAPVHGYQPPAPEAVPEALAAPPASPAPPRAPTAMPPLSVLSAPPPPDAPPAAGAAPRLSLAPTGAPPPALPPTGGKPGLQIKVAGEPPKKGGKPPVIPGRPPAGKPLSKKPPKVSPMVQIGIGVLVLAVSVGLFYTYRILFPPPAKVVKIDLAPIAKGPSPEEMARASAIAAAKAANEIVAAERAKAERARAEAAAAAAAAVPDETTESVMANTDLSSDVKVNSTHLNAAVAASPAFRAFVANASIGGVFQGTPSRALINGQIVREGQMVDDTLGVVFERIDAAKKAIFFKDASGAEVSKNY
jgi:hypothetical protein